MREMEHSRHSVSHGRRTEDVARQQYEPPVIVDLGQIGDHTFNTPGKGDKGVCGEDPMFGEPACSGD